MLQIGWLLVGLASWATLGQAETGPMLQVGFETGQPIPEVLVPRGDTKVDRGVVRTSAADRWARGGLEVGPVPSPQGKLVISYEFRPVKLGAQSQEFVSQTPSTHWYMIFAGPQGQIRVHTRYRDQWQHRASSPQPVLHEGVWYTAQVELGRRWITYRVCEKATGELAWETPGRLPMDDLGEETSFVVCDESPKAGDGATEWDNLSISTDDPEVRSRFVAHQRALAEERVELERGRAAAANLREQGVAMLPIPRKVELREGAYRLPEAPTIRLEPGCDQACADAVRIALADRLQRKVGDAKGPAADIVLHATPGASASPQAYRLEVGSQGIVLEARSPQGFFYAAQTLSDLVATGGSVPCIQVADAPAIENRLVMIAIDQGGFQRVDVDYWKRIIRELAAVKITHVMPYFEGAGFLYEKYPFMTAKGSEGFTKEKACLLSEYGHGRFVELLPQQQTLGHSGSMLCHEQLADLRESGDVFCSSNPKTFAFLGELMDELTAAFPYSRWIHCGGDEFTHGFAQCPNCKAQAEAIGQPGLYAQHMMRVREMLRQRDRGMMIWWHEQGFTEAAADRLSKDIVIFDWHYGNQASYPSLERLQRKGFNRTWATPAVTRYYSGSDDFDETFGNIQGFLRAGAKAGVPGECTCTWTHGIWGGRNLFELNFYALLWSAQCAWNPAMSDAETFRWQFARRWFGLEGARRGEEVLQAIHAPFGAHGKQGYWGNCRELEPIIAEKTVATAKRLKEKPELVGQSQELLEHCAQARSILTQWQKEARRNRVTVDYLLHDVHIHEIAARKLLAVDLLLKDWEKARTVSRGQRQAVLSSVLEECERLVKDLDEIEGMYRRSVVEAGGGECGWGGWATFVAKGGIQFRARDGRANLQETIAKLQNASDAEALTELPF
jgi:hypothetical protein